MSTIKPVVWSAADHAAYEARLAAWEAADAACEAEFQAHLERQEAARLLSVSERQARALAAALDMIARFPK